MILVLIFPNRRPPVNKLPPPITTRTDELTAELMLSLLCEPCGNKYCWVPGIADLATVKRYGLEGHLHIQITDSEMGKWVDELVRSIFTLMIAF